MDAGAGSASPRHPMTGDGLHPLRLAGSRQDAVSSRSMADTAPGSLRTNGPD